MKHRWSLLRQAREFWDTHLQGRLIVPWLEFIEAFGQVHTFMNPNEPPALKRTVDLLENNYVSRFEFDVFTRSVSAGLVRRLWAWPAARAIGAGRVQYRRR